MSNCILSRTKLGLGTREEPLRVIESTTVDHADDAELLRHSARALPLPVASNKADDLRSEHPHHQGPPEAPT